MKMSASSRALVLGRAIGNECAGKSAFFVGMDRDNNSVWGVRCVDGDRYVVRVGSDDGGGLRVGISTKRWNT